MSTDNLARIPEEQEPERETGGPLIIDGISYIPSSVLLTGIPKLAFKNDKAFGVLDPRGEAPRSYSNGSELGMYFNDTRYLSTWEMTFNGFAPVALAHELRFGGSTLVLSMSNRDLPILNGAGRIQRDTFLIRRILTLFEDRIYEVVAIRNFDTVAHSLHIEQWAGSRFDDVFEVRGFPREKRGRMLPPEEPEEYNRDGQRTAMLQYEGLDNKIRRAYIHKFFDAKKVRLSPSLAGYSTEVHIPPKGDVFLRTMVCFDEPGDGTLTGKPFADMPVREVLECVSSAHSVGPYSALEIESDNAIVNRAITNAKIDIRMLLTAEDRDTLYPYAGVPWYSAPFGRDGIITAYQMLPWHPLLARGVLDYTFACLGKHVDEFTDEQPGKVFHEMRRGEMSNTREVPFIPYYGSVDSTPLALILLHEYFSWTKDLDRLKQWWPDALRALEWIEKWGDADGDGFLEYIKRSPTGLLNQGWKDSNDSVMHSDGTLASAPIRLCEVQAYAFRARMNMSSLARQLGDEALASRLRMEALQLRSRFNEKFWDADREYVYLALGSRSEPCDVISSNMGHCLFSQILSNEQAAAVSRHLMSDAMFNGYGIRTLADTEASYNPMSYHNGSIWPHDNSLIMEGFRNYGHTAELERLCLAMISVLEASTDFRLPELFCGFRKRGTEPPVPYEVACKPQAWAAGSVFLMLKTMLGISMDPDQHHLVFRSPVLTSKISTLEVHGLQGRDWEMDIRLRRSPRGVHVDVLKKSGNIRVLTVR